MRSNPLVKKDMLQAKVVERLTAVFEGIASAGITRIRSRTIASQRYFQELWQLYVSLRIDPEERLTEEARQRLAVGIKPRAYLLITAEGTFSGNLDQRIIQAALSSLDSKTTDLLVVGTHGALLLAQQGIKPTYAFKMPAADRPDAFAPITRLVSRYPQPTVFYQTYRSLARQELAKIDLVTAVRTLGSDQPGEQKSLISSRDYVFEPSLHELADFMESNMLQAALAQILLESRLALYAARFKAMNLAHQNASDLSRELALQFNRVRRAQRDERQKETFSSFRAKSRRVK